MDDSLDLEDDPSYHEYWFELGRFIHSFSHIEMMLGALVHRYSGIPKNLAPAAFHGLRIDNAKDTVNRLLEAGGETEKQERLQRPFAQLTVIAGMRNNLVHWGATKMGDGFVVDNGHLAFTADRLRVHSISPDDLRHMRLDLGLILVHITAAIFEGTEHAGAWPDFTSALARPWHYKPPPQPPVPKRLEALGLPPAQPRQPSSSQG